MTTLHAIADAIIEAAQVDENGELTPESIAALDALNLTLHQKVEAYAHVYVELTTKACACKELAAFYEKKAKAPKAAAERLKARLMAEMKRLETTKVETATCVARIHQSPTKLVIKNGARLPDEWTIVDRRADAQRIRKALEAGQVLDFAELEHSEHLRFA